MTTAGESASQVPESWSDGHRLLFSTAKGASVTLSVLSLPDKAVTPFADVTSMRLTSAVFSPDGRWAVHATTNLAGSQDTVYVVQPFPQTGAKYQDHER